MKYLPTLVLVFLLGTSSLNAQETTYEYGTLLFSEYENLTLFMSDAGKEEFKVPVEGFDKWSGIKKYDIQQTAVFAHMLNKLGADGWEYYATSTINPSNQSGFNLSIFIFRRPKTQ